MARADREQRVDDATRRRFQLGTASNPIFPGLFARASTAVGGSLFAARLAWDGRIVFHPPGGTHHGKRAQASGFCFFNDPVFAILEFLRLGAARVAYLDFDAHHGDGVEDAFADEPRVMTISIHQADLWPRSGRLDDRRGGNARNLPVPRGLNDDEFAVLVDEAALPLLVRFAPEALVVLTGADALAGDPWPSFRSPTSRCGEPSRPWRRRRRRSSRSAAAATTPGTSCAAGRDYGGGWPGFPSPIRCRSRRARCCAICGARGFATSTRPG